MRKFLILVSLVLTLVLGLSACRGSTSTITKTVTRPPHSAPRAPSGVVGPSQDPTYNFRLHHPCDPTAPTYYQQCKGPNPPGAKLPKSLVLGFPSQFGIDFAWNSAPSGATARAYGVHFAISYLSGGNSKDWASYKLRDYQRNGIAFGFVWETTAARSFSGCGAGIYDAQIAKAELRHLGYPTAVVFAATDTDTSGFSLFGTVGAYYHCWASIMGAQAGAYGGTRTMQIAAANGVPYLWQTLAWSYGHHDPRACVYQTNIERPWHGYSMDFDVTLCSHTGLVGQTPPPPPPNPYAIFPKANRHFAHGIIASEYNAAKTWDQFKCTNPVGRRVCKTTRRDLLLLSKRVYFLADHQLVHGHWVKRSRPRWDLPGKQEPFGTRYAGLTHRANGR